MIFKEELDERIKDESDIQTRLRYDDELIEQRIKELEKVILTVNSIPYPSREEKRLKGLCQRELEELNEAKKFFKPISSDIHKQIEI